MRTSQRPSVTGRLAGFRQTARRPARARINRCECREIQDSGVRLVGPGKQNSDKESPISQVARQARRAWFRLISTGRALVDKLAPVGYQDETGFHFGSDRHATAPAKDETFPATAPPSVAGQGELKESAPESLATCWRDHPMAGWESVGGAPPGGA